MPTLIENGRYGSYEAFTKDTMAWQLHRKGSQNIETILLGQAQTLGGKVLTNSDNSCDTRHGSSQMIKSAFELGLHLHTTLLSSTLAAMLPISRHFHHHTSNIRDVQLRCMLNVPFSRRLGQAQIGYREQFDSKE